VAKIDRKEVSSQEFIIEELKSIKRGMTRLERSTVGKSPGGSIIIYIFDLDVPHRETFKIIESAARHFPEMHFVRWGGGKLAMSASGELPVERLNKVQEYLDRKAAQYHLAKSRSQDGNIAGQEIPVTTGNE